VAAYSSNPYPGLRPFEYDDQAHFFGREEQIESLFAKLNQNRFVAVVGASGSGKSSVVRAGLLPRLETAKVWRWIVMRPQARPIHELALAINRAKSEDTGETRTRSDSGPEEGQEIDTERLKLMRTNALLRSSSSGLAQAAKELRLPPGGKFLVIVDQFEEIFRFREGAVTHRDEAAAFVKLLLRASSADFVSVHVMLTVRLDFLGDCTRFSSLPEAINDGQFLVPRLSRLQRRQAIEEPAKRAGRPMTTGLVQKIVNDVGDDPDHLPVMQHALMRTWEEAGSDEIIDLKDFEAAGGMSNALSIHANAIYADLGKGESDAAKNGGPNRFQLAAARLFKATTDLDKDGRAIRKPQTLSSLAEMAGVSLDEMCAIVGVYRMPGTNFLMPPHGRPLEPETIVDISHEALIRKWDKISGSEDEKGWLAEEQSDRRTYRRLLDGARRHADNEASFLSAAETEEGLVWWDPKNRSEAWATQYQGTEDDSWTARFGGPFAAVKSVLDASDAHNKDLYRKERFAGQAKFWISLMAIALLVVGGLGYYAWTEREKAVAARSDAETRADVTKGKFESLLSEQEQVRNERLALQEQLVALRSQQEQTRAASEQLEAKTQERVTTLEAAIENLKGQLAAMGGETEEVRAERRALQEQLASLQQDLAKDTTAELQAKTQARIDTLEATIAALKTKLGQTKKDTAVASPTDGDLKPGETFKDCADCPEMVVIPAGKFTMGSPDSEKGREKNAAPQHTVTIPRAFALGTREVTFDEYDSFALATGQKLPSDNEWGRGKRPVINVSWDDAQGYVGWLSKRTGRTYRLPSEAEWEYAARAETTTPYSFGSEITAQQASFGNNFGKTAKVGSYPANGFGLHDMHGNVWEWVEDCLHKTYESAPSDGSAWTNGGNCKDRILRGGSWSSDQRILRSAQRGWNDTGSRYNYNGFRVARTLDH
jgi:formylglycine-generating enzyme required for sulfatase activity/energy-coupling factor transporter ATP-binding protein EcfA2